MIQIFVKTFVWHLIVALVINLAAAYCVWCLLGLSRKIKLFICLVFLAGIFLPDILFAMTVQMSLPKLPNNILLLLSYLVIGFPLITVVGLLLSERYETNDYLASAQYFGRFKVFACYFLPKFLRAMVPFTIIIFFWLFHNFSLPALCEIELLPNYLFAEFNTFYSFGPFFLKMLGVIPALLILALVYYKLIAPEKYIKTSTCKLSVGYKKMFPALILILIWLGLNLVYPAIYWSFYLSRNWNAIEWSKVGDCWSFTLLVSGAVAIISLLAGSLTLIFKKIKVKLTYLILVCACGPLMIAVLILFLFNLPGFNLLKSTCLPMICVSIIYIPFAMTMMHYLKPKENISYATDLYIPKKSQRIKSVLFPLLWPGYLAIFLVIINFVGKDLDSAILLIPPGRHFLPVRMHLLLHYGDFATLGVIILLYIMVILLTLLIINSCFKWIYKYD